MWCCSVTALPIADENPFTNYMPKMNYTLILLNIIIFAIGMLAPWILVPGATTYDQVVNTLGFIPAYIVTGHRLYTFITSMFLHGGIVHLLGNMLFLYIFGDNIEYVMGSAKYALFYIISGIGASIVYIAALALSPASSIINAELATGVNPWLIPAIGASGAISGVLGAYILLFPTSMVRLITLLGFIPFEFEMPAFAFIAIWFFYQLFYGLATMLTGYQAGVAFWAHVGGFITGIALTPYAVNHERVRHVEIYRL